MPNKERISEKYSIIKSSEEERRNAYVGYQFIDYVFKPKGEDIRRNNNFCLTTENLQKFFYGDRSGLNCYFEVNMQ